MFSESLRRRLELLNRGQLPGNVPAASVPAASVPVTGPPLTLGASMPTPALPPWECMPSYIVPNLPEPVAPPAAVPLSGREVVNSGGCCLRMERPLQELWLSANEVLGKITQEWSRSSEPVAATKGDRLRDELLGFQTAFPQRVLLLDLETCGLAGSTIFLVGILAVHQGIWQIVQLWARNYAEEKAVLQSLWSMAAQYDVLVTFNGKTFDWPQVHARSTIHHLGRDPSLDGQLENESSTPIRDLSPTCPRPRLVHFDLLHHARRMWKSQLPNCRLQTLERMLCGRTRYDDIPGRVIPMAYQEYVRTGDTRQVRRILHHNALDLLTLLQVSLRLMDSLQRNSVEAAARRSAS